MSRWCPAAESQVKGPMLDQQEIRRLVDIQHQSYLLLRWIAKAVEDGFVSFDTAHQYSTLPESAEAWILGHYLNIPASARPSREELTDFCAFFSTYLINSFELIRDPGKRLYSPDAHCFCPMCSWLVDAPNLKTRKVGPEDKRRAQKMRINALSAIVADQGLTVANEQLSQVLVNPKSQEDASLVAYGYDLTHRVQGIANGPAVLALWRAFAWTANGSPKKGFRLKAEMIIDAEQRLLAEMNNNC